MTGLLISRAAAVAVITLFCSCTSQAQPAFIQEFEQWIADYENTRQLEVKVTQQGKMTSVRTDYHYYEMVDKVENITTEQEEAFFTWVETEQARLPAPILMAVGNRIFPKSPAEGMKWFQVGALKSIYDVSRCMDPGAGRLMFDMAMRSQTLAEYAKSHPEEYMVARKEALGLFEAVRKDTSPLWVCAHSMQAMPMGDQPAGGFDVLVTPESEWEARYEEIVANTRKRLAEDPAE